MIKMKYTPEQLLQRAAASRKYYAANTEKILAAKKLKERSADILANKAAYAAKYRPRKNLLFKEFYKNNKELVTAKRRAYTEKNREAIAARRREYAQRNKEKITAARLLRKLQDPEGYRLTERRKKLERRAQRNKAYPQWDRDKTKKRTETLVALCRLLEKLTGEPWHVDHMYPLKCKDVCGLHVWNNLQVLPARLNLWKRDRMMLTEPGEWHQYY